MYGTLLIAAYRAGRSGPELQDPVVAVAGASPAVAVAGGEPQRAVRCGDHGAQSPVLSDKQRRRIGHGAIGARPVPR